MGASEEWIWNGLPVPKAEDDVFPLPGEFFKGEKMSEELKFYSEDFLSSIDPDVMMRLNRTVHVFLQNKGGCGKTFCATLFAQFVGDVLSLPLRCFDLEQLSENGFAAFSSLNVTHIQAMDENRNYIRANIDQIFEPIFNQVEGYCDGVVVIDTGASFYNDFLMYVNEVDLIGALAMSGWRLIIHSIIPGNEIQSCLDGYKDCRETLSGGGWESVIWLNQFFGFINVEKDFIKWPVVQRFLPQFQDALLLPQVTDQRTRAIFSYLRDNHMTFRDFTKKVYENMGKSLSADAGIFVPRTMDLNRLKSMVTVSSQGVKGLMAELARFGWSPRPLPPLSC